ncbi:uncharacterized protein [Misgurnus anguillicaudatus]|uniref:uncharacterized protein n=1 Tax=Misgurnus anguillicaudatus TaxID=75329 RepID=UPI002435F23E|nr:uncharacterized protein LOC129441798 [Misgurnus anguillicaudatus]XP_055057480.1 uncharacterized protein LOC129441810 [Misgurnus anguillicaudatus]
MDSKWAYTRRNIIRKRAVRTRVNKMFESLGKEIQSPPESKVEAGSSVQSQWHQETPNFQTKNLSCCDPFIKSLLIEVVRNQEILMEQQRSIIEMVHDLQANNVREITDFEEDPLNQSCFPIEDLSSLIELENDLRSCPETRRKVVLELGLLGGVDVKDTVWRIMKMAIKNDFAKTVNWKGVNGKTPFHNLEFKSVVIDAVRRNPSCTQATELEVENVIKRWFHLAGDREGGRKKRMQLQNFKAENSFSVVNLE